MFECRLIWHSNCSFMASGYSITQLIFIRFNSMHSRRTITLSQVLPSRKRSHPSHLVSTQTSHHSGYTIWRAQ